MGMQTQIDRLIEIYRTGQAAAAMIGDQPVTMPDTPDRTAAHNQLEQSRRQFADTLEVYATRAAVAATGKNLPTSADIKTQKAAIYAEFQAAIR